VTLLLLLLQFNKMRNASHFSFMLTIVTLKVGRKYFVPMRHRNKFVYFKIHISRLIVLAA
jgi:hypothetical protein